MCFASGILFASLSMVIALDSNNNNVQPVLAPICYVIDDLFFERDICAFVTKDFCIMPRPISTTESIVEVTVDANEDSHSFAIRNQTENTNNVYEIHESLIFMRLVDVESGYIPLQFDDRFPIKISNVAVEKLLTMDLNYLKVISFQLSILTKKYSQSVSDKVRYYDSKECDYRMQYYQGRDQFCFELIGYENDNGDIKMPIRMQGVVLHPETDELCGVITGAEEIDEYSVFWKSKTVLLLRVTLLTSFIDQIENFKAGNENPNELTPLHDPSSNSILAKIFGV